MSPADVEDFVSDVKLKLLERDYAVIRAFEGRCSFATWLALIVQRHLHDHRAQVSGRFRPSAEAQRLGAEAIRLEALLVRDGKRIEEAIELLRRSGSAMTPAEAERIAARLPARQPRPVAVPLDSIAAEAPAPQPRTVMPRDLAGASHTISSTIREAIAGLDARDQTILQLLFAAGMSVAAIARSLGIGQQVLYRRVRALCGELRGRLIAAGIDAERMRELIDSPDLDLDLGLAEPPDRGARPSNNTGMPHE